MRATAVVMVLLLAVGCRDDGGDLVVTDSTETTSIETTSTTTEPADAAEGDLVFLYTEGEQVWGELDTGERVPIDDVGRSPHLVADGRTILYVRGEWPDTETIALDVGTGERRELGDLGQGGYFDVTAELGPDGRLAATRWSDVWPAQIDLVAWPSLDVDRTITLGPETTNQGYLAVAWDADGAHLLAFSWDTENEASWWWIDTTTGSSTLVDLPDELHPTQHEHFFLGPAASQGVFPALLEGGWGELRVDAGGGATFVVTRDPGPAPDGDAAIDRFWEVEDGRLVAYYTTYVEGSARLLHIAADGTTEVLVDGVDWIDAA
jgi:hypothetical protein